MADDLLKELPRDLPSFLARFGTDAQCRAYLVRARWPDGFRCDACGHDAAWSHHRRLIEECCACGKQHSILAGTIFEQTKTGLTRWFLAIYLVTSSKGGISALELQRQLGFASYGTAWTWLHKIRRAMVDPDRRQLEGDVEADETLVGGRKPGKRGRGAAGKTVVAGAIEAAPSQTKKRELGRLRLAAVASAAGADLERFITANVAEGAAITTDGWRGYGGLAAAGYDHHAIDLSRSWGEADQRLPAVHLVFGLAKRWLLGTHHGAVSGKYLQRYLDEFVFRFNRRRARSPAQGFARVLQNAVRVPPATHREIVAAGAT